MNCTYHIPSEYIMPAVPMFPNATYKKHAEICPVCKGSGKYTEKGGVFIGTTGTGSGYYYQRTCHGCGGLGWVIITDECSFTDIKWTCK